MQDLVIQVVLVDQVVVAIILVVEVVKQVLDLEEMMVVEVLHREDQHMELAVGAVPVALVVMDLLLWEVMVELVFNFQQHLEIPLLLLDQLDTLDLDQVVSG